MFNILKLLNESGPGSVATRLIRRALAAAQEDERCVFIHDCEPVKARIRENNRRRGHSPRRSADLLLVLDFGTDRGMSSWTILQREALAHHLTIEQSPCGCKVSDALWLSDDAMAVATSSSVSGARALTSDLSLRPRRLTEARFRREISRG